MIRVAALYVAARGPYYGVPGVDPWGLPELDARLYAGPHPVVAHPPCARWGRYAEGGPSHHGRFVRGDDGGCFGAALCSVRAWGGVLEHPAGSSAWDAFWIMAPPRSGGWVSAGDGLGWTCCVDQGHYGHPAAKATWLYVAPRRPEAALSLPSLRWGKCREVRAVIDRQGGTTAQRVASRDAQRARGVLLLSARARSLTPPPFRDLLVSLARSVGRE